MNFQALNKQRKFLLISAAVGIISIFLPWHTAGGLFEGLSINGFHGVGVLVFLLFAGVGIFALLGDQTKPLDKTFWLVTLAAGAINILGIIIRISGVSDALGILKPGLGIWLSLAASIGMVAFAWLYKNPADTLQNAFDSLKKNIASNTSSPTTPGPTSNKMDELERLIEMKNQGKISEEEYQSLKAKIL